MLRRPDSTGLSSTTVARGACARSSQARAEITPVEPDLGHSSEGSVTGAGGSRATLHSRRIHSAHAGRLPRVHAIHRSSHVLALLLALTLQSAPQAAAARHGPSARPILGRLRARAPRAAARVGAASPPSAATTTPISQKTHHARGAAAAVHRAGDADPAPGRARHHRVLRERIRVQLLVHAPARHRPDAHQHHARWHPAQRARRRVPLLLQLPRLREQHRLGAGAARRRREHAWRGVVRRLGELRVHPHRQRVARRTSCS